MVVTQRGTTNRNDRGSSYDRRKRKQWLLDNFGDGVTATCTLQCSAKCLGTVDITTLQVDRITPGIEGGTYSRDNIQPGCGPCNAQDGGVLGAKRKANK